MRKLMSDLVTFIEMRWTIMSFFEWLNSGVNGWAFAAGLRLLLLQLTFGVLDLLDD